MKISLFLLILIFCQSAFSFGNENTFKRRTSEKNCSTVDLRGPDLGPVRNQDTVGWCFGFTAADLVSYRIKKRVSAIDVSITFYNKMKEMPRDAILSQTGGGQSMSALESSIQDGFCAESDLPSEDYVFPKNCGQAGGQQIADIIKSIEKMHDAHEKVTTTCQLGGIPSVFKNLSADEIQKVLNAPKLSAFQMILELQNQNCKNRIKPDKKLRMRGGLRDGYDTLLDIDAQLNKSNPVSYNYDANFLLPPSERSGIANHYSSIVGRRFDKKTNSCQYLIRNSWGRSCNIYPPPLDSQCEEGNIWVDEETIGKSVIGIHYLD